MKAFQGFFPSFGVIFLVEFEFNNSQIHKDNAAMCHANLYIRAFWLKLFVLINKVFEKVFICGLELNHHKSLQ